MRIVGAVWLLKEIGYLSRTVARSFTVGGLSTYALPEIASYAVVLALAVYFLLGGKHLVRFVFKEKVPGAASTDDRPQ